MAITQRFLGQDEYFRRTTGQKLIVNDISYMSAEDLKNLDDKLITQYNNTDVISTIPQCDCGVVSGRYKLGKLCPNCGTMCKEAHEKVEPVLWLRALTPNTKFLNPDFWSILKNILFKKVDCLRWLCDSSYNPGVNLPTHVYGILELLGNVRKYEVVMNKLPAILEYLIVHPNFRDPDKRENLTLLLDMFHKEKDKLFSDYLPIMNKQLFVMENTSKGKFINFTVADAIDIVMMWVKASNEEKQTDKKINIVTGQVISKLSDLYMTYFNNYVYKKIGIFRKHVYGTRSHFTFRSVIVSIPGKHRHDEIYIPWSIAVTVFRPHILNILVKRYKMPYIDVNNLLFRSVKKYEPIVHEALLTLMREAPTGRINVIAQRNPSLGPGSAMSVWISKIKTEPEDKTINISQLVIKQCNGLTI